MVPTNQRTLRKEVMISGIGTHTGEKSIIRLLPSKPNMGVIFVSSRGIIGADLFALGDSRSNTSLRDNGFYVETVEHLLSCLYGMFIDNVEVEVYGTELPIGDGSARIFYEAIKEVGVKDQGVPRAYLQITKPYTFQSSPTRSISIGPADHLKITCSLDWHPKIKGSYTYIHGSHDFTEIAYARTFADKKYVLELQKNRRALGSKAGVNFLDIEDGEPIIENEFVKHKVLDILGDISLLYGLQIQGEIISHNSGHALHHDLLRGIFNGDNSNNRSTRSTPHRNLDDSWKSQNPRISSLLV